MRRQRFKLVVLALLPMMALRLLMPAGFMLSFEPGGLRVVLCPAQGEVMPIGAGGEHVHHHHQDGGHRSHQAQNCPFAIGGMTAPPTVLAGLTDAPPVATYERSPSSTPAHTGVTIRANPIRGPPLLV
jgi:hypothetical protein